MKEFILEDWVLNNIRGWLGEIKRKEPYELVELSVPFDVLSDRYRTTLESVVSKEKANYREVDEICELASIVCSRVVHRHYPACQVEDYLMSKLDEMQEN